MEETDRKREINLQETRYKKVTGIERERERERIIDKMTEKDCE